MLNKNNMLPGNYYWISTVNNTDKCLIYCYCNPDFKDGKTIGIGFNIADGAAWMPLEDINDDSIIEEINFNENRCEELKNILILLLNKIPKTKNDYSGVGRCFGCGVVKWVTGDSSYTEKCHDDCILQKAKKEVNYGK